VRTDRYGGTIPPRAELLTSNASVVFTSVSAFANLQVVIEQHLEDLSVIDVRENEPKTAIPSRMQLMRRGRCQIVLRTSPGGGSIPV
jgi:hypothetical protein